MRHVGGRNKTFAWWLALCAMASCTTAPRTPSEAGPSHTTPAAKCRFGDVTLRGRDSALIVFPVADSAVLTAEDDSCVLRFAAAALRPWPMASHDRWTVELVPSDAGATAHRRGSKAARDAVDGGVTMIVTEDLDLVAYASIRPDLHVTALPWDRTYLRLSLPSGDSLGIELAWDAVRVDARPAETLTCDTVTTAGGSTDSATRSRRTRVVYELGDVTARELAERVVAIVPDSAEVVGLAGTDLDSALRSGDDLSYIVSVPRSTDGGCAVIALLLPRAPWLTVRSIIPLIDTRAHAIAPRTRRP